VLIDSNSEDLTSVVGFASTNAVIALPNALSTAGAFLSNKAALASFRATLASSNIFSISPEVIISEKGFFRLNSELRKRGFQVEEVSYAEIAKMEGLLRCSTMPLRRKINDSDYE